MTSKLLYLSTFLVLGLMMGAALAEPMALFTFSSESVEDLDACNVTNKVSCRRIHVNQDVLNSGKDILVPGLDVIMRHKGLPDANNVDKAYLTLQNSDGCWAVLTFTKASQSWRGSIECSNKALKIRNCGSRCHVVVESRVRQEGVQRLLDRQTCTDRSPDCANLGLALFDGLYRPKRGFFRRVIRRILRRWFDRLTRSVVARLTSRLCQSSHVIGVAIQAQCPRTCGQC